MNKLLKELDELIFINETVLKELNPGTEKYKNILNELNVLVQTRDRLVADRGNSIKAVMPVAGATALVTIILIGEATGHPIISKALRFVKL